jgi:hypothetical protein
MLPAVNRCAKPPRGLRFGPTPTARNIHLAAEGNAGPPHHRNDPPRASQPDRPPVARRIFTTPHPDIIPVLDRLHCRLHAILTSENRGHGWPRFSPRATKYLLAARRATKARSASKDSFLACASGLNGRSPAGWVLTPTRPYRRANACLHARGLRRRTRFTEPRAPTTLPEAPARSRTAGPPAGNNTSAHIVPPAREHNHTTDSARTGSRSPAVRRSTRATSSRQYASCVNSLLRCGSGREKVADHSNPR